MSSTAPSYSVENKQTVPKHTQIQFCDVEQAEYTDNSIKEICRKKVIVTNNEPKEKKHDPNKFLLGYENAPEDLSSDIVVNNCNTACIFRECDICGLHKRMTKFCLKTPILSQDTVNRLFGTSGIIQRGNKWQDYYKTIQ